MVPYRTWNIKQTKFVKIFKYSPPTRRGQATIVCSSTMARCRTWGFVHKWGKKWHVRLMDRFVLQQCGQCQSSQFTGQSTFLLLGHRRYGAKLSWRKCLRVGKSTVLCFDFCPRNPALDKRLMMNGPNALKHSQKCLLIPQKNKTH